MGEFNWDGEEYTEGGSGGEFISEDAFNRLVYNDAVVQVVGIREGVSNFDPKKGPQPQWLVDFIAPDGSEYTKGWTQSNEERNSRMERIRNTIEASGEPLEASFIKIGRRFDLSKPKKVS